MGTTGNCRCSKYALTASAAFGSGTRSRSAAITIAIFEYITYRTVRGPGLVLTMTSDPDGSVISEVSLHLQKVC